MKKLIIGFMLGIILCSGIVYGLNTYESNAIEYSPTDTSWEVSNVNEAINSLYENSKSNDSNEIIVGMSMTQSITDTSSWNHIGTCKLTYNGNEIDSFSIPAFNYDIASKTTVGTTKIIEGKKVRLDCNTTGSLNSNNAIMTITLNLYVNDVLVRTISIQNAYTSSPSLSDTWNIAGY